MSNPGQASGGNVSASMTGGVGVGSQGSGGSGAPVPPDPIMQFFAYDHLPPGLQRDSKPFSGLALWIVDYLPCDPERTVALRKLLEAKDAAVRARLFK
jgi:hypothetical protein